MSGEISVVIMMRLHRRAGIDMNKKILVLAVVAVVLILPGVYFGGLIPLTATTYSFATNRSPYLAVYTLKSHRLT